MTTWLASSFDDLFSYGNNSALAPPQNPALVFVVTKKHEVEVA